ncbi:hypothetical protein RhiirA4_431562 [Rhizophagus irregularis]|uniref:Uncharacterized protein n=1 Tax=Rhizophagus irregularis TaxID=588596 RepID=A0A2I1HQC8_9GLOM|nr:hypothetical protein RhiirA4_431562 [Rhizophagus irregularis]
MDVESDNDDNNGEDDNGNGEEENNEDDDDDNNEDDDDDIYGEETFIMMMMHEDTIVDSSLDNDHMSKINGSFAPYFENATSALLFCWIQKHNISTNAYNDLVEILQHQKFEVKDGVKNIRRFRRTPKNTYITQIQTQNFNITLYT